MSIGLRQQGIWFSPFPVSPSGGKRGAPPPPLRYGSGKAPAQSRTLPAFWAGKGKGFGWTGLPPGSRPEPRVLNFMTQTGSLAHKSGQLDVLRT